MRKLYVLTLSAAIIVFIAGTSNAAESGICAAVLDNKAFDTYNTQFQSNIADKTANEICNLHISSRDELRNQSASLSSGGAYGIISGFFDAAASSGSHSVEETYDKMCNKHDASFIKDVFLSQQMQITTENVRAWERCIEVTTATGVFSALHISADNKIFTITVNYKKPTGGPKLVLKDIDPRYGMSCLVNGKKMDDFVPEDNGLSGKFAITCERPDPNTNNTIVISTNVDQIGPFEVPSRAYSDLFYAIQQNAAQVARLTAIITEIRNKRPQVFVQRAGGTGMPCNTPWPANITAECPPDSVRISGGCDFTCLGLTHTISQPTDQNGWRCGAISNFEGDKTGGPGGGPRTYTATALCLRP
jgi:hypothetical protein